jgi:putative methyltransferase (TIGR04325 family)
MSIKDLARAWTPPALLNLVRSARARGKPSEWVYCPEGWPETGPELAGWDVESVAETQLRLWPGFLHLIGGTGPLGVNHTDFAPTGESVGAHNTIMTFGYVLARATGGKSEVSLLDWGGGIGHYGAFARALLPDTRIDYHCKDLPGLCAAGRKAFPEGTFHDSEESCAGRTYDLVVASSSLHYSRDWSRVLAFLAERARDYVLITRLPVVREVPSFVVAQYPHGCGYLTGYPGWFLNRSELLQEAERSRLRLEREFVVDEQPEVPGSPEPGGYGGFLFRRH